MAKITYGSTILPENAFANAEMGSVIDFMCSSLTVLWKDWPRKMELAAIGESGFVLRGECPHCRHLAAFSSVTKSFTETGGRIGEGRIVAALKCLACHEYILGIVKLVPDAYVSSQFNWVYETHYPLGSPDDSVAEEVPDAIATEFKEALRCRWIGASKATVLMCRRSLQVSCDMEKAEGRDLFCQIDDLATNQKITETLKKMAHRIRLLGKKGAHGDYSDIDDTIIEKDADDAITFMGHYFEHVYVLPKKLSGDSSS